MSIEKNTLKKQGVLKEPRLTQTVPSETVKLFKERVRNVRKMNRQRLVKYLGRIQ
jgi:hypothetical protein